MTWAPEEMRRKLAQIDRLPAGELAGWWRYVHGYRESFAGEIAALMSRARVLGIDLSVKSLSGAQSASAIETRRGAKNTAMSTKF